MNGIQTPEWAELKRILESQKETTQIQLDHINEKIRDITKALNELSEGNAVQRVKLERLQEDTDKIELSLLALSKVEQLEKDTDDIRDAMRQSESNIHRRLNIIEENKDKFLKALILINNKVDDIQKKENQENPKESDWKSHLNEVLMKHLPIILLTIVVVIIILGIFLMNIPPSNLKEILSLMTVSSPSSP